MKYPESHILREIFRPDFIRRSNILGLCNSAICDCVLDEQTPEHILKVSPLLTNRKEAWPENTTYHAKVWGQKQTSYKPMLKYKTVHEKNIWFSFVSLQDTLVEQLEQCARGFEKAERYEMLGEIYRLIIPIYEKKRDFQVCYSLGGKCIILCHQCPTSIPIWTNHEVLDFTLVEKTFKKSSSPQLYHLTVPHSCPLAVTWLAAIIQLCCLCGGHGPSLTTNRAEHCNSWSLL
jgi:hypothetical protein